MTGPFVLFANIPAELRQYAQWVCWRREDRLGKMTKVPYSALSGGRASSTNPATWASYAGVLAYYQAHRSRFDGIGFVLSDADPFVGIDLDHVVDIPTGHIAEWCLPVILRCASYSEVSPSGTGIRIFVKGKLPSGGRKHGPLELYESARYLTVTGNTLIGGPATIEERSDQLAIIHREVFGEPEPAMPTPRATPVFLPANDYELLDRAMNAVNGERFRALWLGNRTGYQSDSESDQALCSHLVYWCNGDTQRADALFRQSGLYRDKWDDRHAADGRTYGQMTIAKALQGLANVTVASKADGTPGALPRGAFFGGVPL